MWLTRFGKLEFTHMDGNDFVLKHWDLQAVANIFGNQGGMMKL